MEGVYPALYRHCKRRGFDFRMVDLRQGVGGPTANRHDTARIHLEAIRRCQDTPGPNFVVRALSKSSWLFSEAHRDALPLRPYRASRRSRSSCL